MTQIRSCARPAVTPTVVIWLPAAMTKPAALKGEYLTEMGHACPTDHERGLTLPRIALAAAGINAAAIWHLCRLRGRDAPLNGTSAWQ
jgi:hypothetical protein